MATKYTVRQARTKDILGMLKLVEDEGWNDVKENLQIMFDIFPEGVIVAESVDGEIISTCVAVPWDDSNGQVAMYVTTRSYRGQGIGRKVFNLSLKALGNRNVAVNAVSEKVDMYAAASFKIVSMDLLIYEFPLRNFNENMSGKSSFQIGDVDEIGVHRIIDYDRKIHPMPRHKILKWALAFAAFVRVALDGNEVNGWGALLKSNRGYRLMPLYGDTPEIAKFIAIDLLKQVAGDPKATIEVIFPEDNKTAESVYTNLGLFDEECRHSTYKRMYTENDIPIPSHFVYSILSDNNVLI